ncbi:class I SAM-dependent methyltransferase [Mesobacillus subterraneus]|uniref:Class I SAM-dependent methyltransferase n=1 Tax=Mesobacillus subterraneus TaxID=285983 RepID=A0A3R9E4T4_9BACI|nr:class I SAM-dependent methyltransferase [Mesobacillus subterraneus]RSD26093.1 class I SAM-dependent methyltransferase [Mesobacillus subterraneus]
MKEKEAVKAQFGKNASHYVKSKSHAKGQDLAMVVDLVREAGVTGNLLDIATGGGHVANALAPYFSNVTAYDLTESMLKEAEKYITSNGHANVSYVQGDAESISFAEESFEVVTCRIAAHHFPHVDRFVGEVFRVLKTGGLFILIDNNAPENDVYDHFYNKIEKMRDRSHFRAYKKSEWISLLENSGFNIKRMYTFEKKFHYDTWCTMMDLPIQEKSELTTYMVAAQKDLKDYFSIEIAGGEVIAFQGESMLLSAFKK